MGIIKKLIMQNKSFFRFCIVGGISTLLDLSVYLLLVDRIGAIFAKTISMSFSMVLSFGLNKVWSFSAKNSKDRTEILRYMISQLINLLTNVSINYIMLKISGIKLLAFVVATGLAMMVNYILQRFFVFRSKGESI